MRQAQPKKANLKIGRGNARCIQVHSGLQPLGGVVTVSPNCLGLAKSEPVTTAEKGTLPKSTCSTRVGIQEVLAIPAPQKTKADKKKRTKRAKLDWEKRADFDKLKTLKSEDFKEVTCLLPDKNRRPNFLLLNRVKLPFTELLMLLVDCLEPGGSIPAVMESLVTGDSKPDPQN